MISAIPVKNCCGCTACSAICPTGAIRMTADLEGFSYPRICSDRCISCGLCQKVCPVLHPPEPGQKYAGSVVVQSCSPEVLRQSTSGGFVDALNQHILETEKGCVVGVGFDEAFLPVHQIAGSYEKAKEFRNSKYAQSRLDGIFPRVRRLLETGKTVAFTGTPCQVAGLKNYLGRAYPGLITVDLICRGVPSPMFWKRYLDWQAASFGSPAAKVSCRKKTYGYHSGTLEIQFENGRRYSGSNRVDYYMKAFHQNICSRPSCYACPFKTHHRCSDFTVFDCWHPERATFLQIRDDDRGFSGVLVHTQKGRQLLQTMDNIRCFEADPEKILAHTGAMADTSIGRPEERNSFYRDLNAAGFRYTVGKYVQVSVFDRFVERMKPLVYLLKNRRRREAYGSDQCDRSGL